MSYVRVLAIPSGKKADAEGRTVGDDWLLADLGEGEAETGPHYVHYYLTTDRIHASELADYEELTPAKMAEILARLLNAEIEKNRR